MKWFFIILILFIILVMGGYILTIYPGTLTIHWVGYQIKTSLLVAFIVLFIAFIVFSLILKLFRIPSMIKAKHQKHAYEKGIHALAGGISALFAFDAKQTESRAQEIRHYLNENNLATFLEAEAAFLKGDMEEAQRLYQPLCESEDYKTLAHRGMAHIYLKLDELQKALAELNELIKLNPTQRLKNQKAEVLTKLTKKEIQQGNLKTAFTYAQEAYELAADKHVISADYISLLRQLKGDKAALKAIEQTWAVAPDPKLAQLYVELMRPDSGLNKYKVVKRLASFAPHDPESFLMTARAAIDTNQREEAQAILDQLIADGYKSEEVLKLKDYLVKARYT